MRTYYDELYYTTALSILLQNELDVLIFAML
jgi:hypothetical protein